MSRKPIIIGNWKMHKTVREAVALADAVAELAARSPNVDVGIAPTYTALYAVAERIKGSSVLLAAQNCHEQASGAFTGEIASPMLQDVGCSHVIVGHSERRQYFAETDELVNAKAKAVLTQGLIPVICIGETLEQREAGETFEVVRRQLQGALLGLSREDTAQLVIAYEPVWAIGTGRTATTDQAQEVHGFLRAQLIELVGTKVAESLRIQYGGSVKPANIAALMAQPDVDGALVGGASLDAQSFGEIIQYDKQQ